MTALAITSAFGSAPGFRSAYVIGLLPEAGLAERLAAHGLLPRIDRRLTLDDNAAANRSRIGYRIDQAVREADRAILFVGSGVACAAIAWWTRLSPRHYADRVAGALFYAPEDGQGEAAAQFASPSSRLRYPSAVIDGFAARPDAITVARLANDWGSQIVGGAPTLPGAATKPPAHWLNRTLRSWTASIVEHEVRAVSATTGVGVRRRV